MFDELIQELQRLDGTHTVSVSIHSDEEGYLDRECPSGTCQFSFKVWETLPIRNATPVFCPFCRHSAPSDNWYTQGQVEAIQKAAFAKIQGRIGAAMKRDADRWNRQQSRNGFLRITMNVDSRPQPVALPPAAAEPMRLKISCPACACHYAVIGSAFFCPACGHNAADIVFAQSIASIRNALDVIPEVRSAISDPDVAETTVRLVIENGLQNAITAFQRNTEAIYANRFPLLPAPRRNAFQNLSEGSALWRAASGKQYSDYMTTTELTTLVIYFQQRHLLAHCEGLVDADYITRSGDTSYVEGQRLVIREASVRECLELVEKLVRKMDS